MGSCSSSHEAEPVETAQPRSAPRSARGKSPAAEVHNTPAPIPGAALPGELEPAPKPPPAAATAELPSFDEATATPVQLRWYAAAKRAKLTAQRRERMLKSMGYTPKEVAVLQTADPEDIVSAFFQSRARLGIATLDALFHRCTESNDSSSASAASTPADALEGSRGNSRRSRSSIDRTHASLDAEGIQALRGRLGLTEDVHILFVLFRLGCQGGPWTVPFDVFAEGCMGNCLVSESELTAWAAESAQAYDELDVRSAEFGAFYRFLFAFVKPAAARSLGFDVALTVWQDVLCPKWAGGETWLAYLETVPPKAVFRDLWMQLGVFAATVTWPDCPEADDDSAWPSLIDGFIDYVRHPPAAPQ